VAKPLGCGKIKNGGNDMAKKRTAKTMALVLSALMLLSSCSGGDDSQTGGGNEGGGGGSTASDNPGGGASSGGGSSGAVTPSNGGEPIKDMVWWESTGTRELEGFFILNTEKSQDLNVLCNAYSPLLEVDNKGVLGPAVATEWNTPDGGLTWNFTLRDDVTWVDVDGNEKAKCTAQDWVTAMEWILNYHKNGTNNTSMLTSMLKGAQVYLDLTKDMDPSAAKALNASSPEFKEVVGIEAPDDTHLIYHCVSNLPYFDTLCTSAAMYPISQAEIDEKTVDGMISMDNRTMWYNGPYTITSYIQNNEKVLTKNESYWDKDCSLFDTVTIRMIGDGTMDDQLYQTGEVDQCDLNEATLRSIYDAGESNQYYNQLVEKMPRKFSYQFHLNFNKMNEDGTPDTNWNTAVANTNFRRSLYYGLDLTKWWARTNYIYPTHCENLAYTMKGLVYFSDGTDYVDRVVEKLGYPTTANADTPRRLDTAKAAEFRDKAIEELTAKGVTFPVEVDYYIQAGSQTALDAATLLSEAFDDIGDNYVKLNICTYTSSATQEVYNPGLHSIVGNGWGADYGDVENFLGQELYGVESAYYSRVYSRINSLENIDPELKATYEEFTKMAQAASQIYDDMDARYEAFADAEVFFLENALTIPSEYEVVWQLTKFNDYSKMIAMYGIQNYTYKNWESSTVPYTTAEYEQFAAEYNKATASSSGASAASAAPAGSVAPEESTAATESAAPEESTAATESTAPEESTAATESAVPEESTAATESAAPEESTAATESAAPEESTAATESAAPANQ